MVGVNKIVILSVICSLNSFAGIFDELIDSLNINQEKKEVNIQNSTLVSTTNGKNDNKKKKKENIIFLGEKVTITNSNIEVDNKGDNNASKKVVVIGKEINIENSDIQSNSEKNDAHRENTIIENSGSVILNGEKVNVENSNIKVSSKMGAGNTVIGTNGSVVLGSH